MHSPRAAVADNRIGRPEQRMSIGEFGLSSAVYNRGHPSAPPSPDEGLRRPISAACRLNRSVTSWRADGNAPTSSSPGAHACRHRRSPAQSGRGFGPRAGSGAGVARREDHPIGIELQLQYLFHRQQAVAFVSRDEGADNASAGWVRPLIRRGPGHGWRTQPS